MGAASPKDVALVPPALGLQQAAQLHLGKTSIRL